METIHRSRWRTDCVQALLQVGYGEAWSSGYDIALERGSGLRSHARSQ
jgi:hypothetical protein